MRKMCQNEVILWGNEQKTGIWIAEQKKKKDSVKESMAKVRYGTYLIGIGNLCGEAFV